MQGVKKRHNSAPGEPTVLESSETELAILPASLVFNQANVVPLLQSLITNVNGSVLQFKLGPAYAIYMIARYHLSSDFIPEQSRHHSLIQMLKSTCSFIKRAVKVSTQMENDFFTFFHRKAEILQELWHFGYQILQSFFIFLGVIIVYTCLLMNLKTHSLVLFTWLTNILLNIWYVQIFTTECILHFCLLYYIHAPGGLKAS